MSGDFWEDRPHETSKSLISILFIFCPATGGGFPPPWLRHCSWPEALHNFASGSWFAWANDTAAYYVANHCPRHGYAVQPADIPPPQSATSGLHLVARHPAEGGRNVHISFVFSVFFLVFKHERDKRANSNGWTDGRARHVMRAIRSDAE